MGHSRYAYDYFDADLVRPLYGYLSRFRSGEVPRWTKKPRLQDHEVLDLLGKPWDEYQDGIPSHELPSGFSKEHNPRGPTQYRVKRRVYLERYRQMVREQDDLRVNREVEFDLNFGNDGRIYRSAPTVPDDVRERLDAVRETSLWDRKIDGYHESFRRWVLTYFLGPRGGIQDVKIRADTHH